MVDDFKPKKKYRGASSKARNSDVPRIVNQSADTHANKVSSYDWKTSAKRKKSVNPREESPLRSGASLLFKKY